MSNNAKGRTYSPKLLFDKEYNKRSMLFLISVFLLFLFLKFSLLYFYFFLLGDVVNPISYIEQFWAMGHFLWAAGIPSCLLGLIGILTYRKKSLTNVSSVKNKVCFRIVSYGKNVTALRSTIDSIIEKMERYPAFPYIVEVFAEEGQPFFDELHPYMSSQVKIYAVPKSYETPNKTMKKARALHYALSKSKMPNDAWIVHLDEESRPSKSMILGIAKAIKEEENSKQYRIGQGVIVYYRHWIEKRFWWWTLLDSGRTGQDIGPFYFQSKFGTSLYGFHGSWILIRNSVAKSIPGGFDLGPRGSITEDAWWCLIANATGYKLRWVEGYLEEQSVRSFRDFCKQRGRWFYGLRLVGKHTPVSFWRKIPIRLNLALWMLVWLSIPYSIAHVFFGFTAPNIMIFLITTSLASYMSMIVSGTWINLNLAGYKNWFLYAGITCLQILLIPVYVLMEIYAALVYGVCFPDRDDFHVIEK